MGWLYEIGRTDKIPGIGKRSDSSARITTVAFNDMERVNDARIVKAKLEGVRSIEIYI